MTINGILVVDKPAGLTSHQVVSRVRKAAGTKRVGHTGTLDPDVSGVLPVCIGTATRLAEYMLEQKKGYVGTVRFGYSTDTQDAGGKILKRVDSSEELSRLSKERVEQALHRFLGTRLQTPPAFSAVKIAGQRAYDLARRGEAVELKPRTVHIYELVFLEWNADLEYPEASFQVICSKGTYIRTLCQDLGDELQVPAHMAGLRRIVSGPFTTQDAHTLEEIEEAARQGRLDQLVLPGSSALPFMRRLLLSNPELSHVENGRALTVEAGRILPGTEQAAEKSAQLVQVLDSQQRLRAIYGADPHGQSGQLAVLRPVKVFKE